MKMQKWIGFFLAGLLICGGIGAGFNALTDPFGVFGDVLLDWWSYDMTQNPRTAKIGWIDKHHDEYDSYIIGCSKTSSYPVEQLNEYFQADFYNMFMYGDDLYDIEKMVEYVLTNYGAENIIVNTGIRELTIYDYETDSYKENLHGKVDGSAAMFYLKYLFSNPQYGIDKIDAYLNDTYLVNENTVFDPVTGAYDKSLRDIEHISSLDEYLEKYPEYLEEINGANTLDKVQECIGSIQRIKEMCDEAGATLTYIISPMYETELDIYANDDLMDFFSQLAEITDFWDFSGYHSVAKEPRYFYDYQHFRNAVGEMALARMFDDDSVYVPEDFGAHVTVDNVEEHINSYFDKTETISAEEKEVPILMYHQILEEDASNAGVTEEIFRSQIAALKENGHESITYGDLLAYVNEGIDLPDKPILITFDDGYADNLELAAPILEEYGMTAVINAIGVSVGKDTYKDTGKDMIPHFSFEDALPWVESGVIDIQSHSYDMHQVESYDGVDYREGVYQKDGESEEDYIKTFLDDFEKSKSEIEDNLGTEVIAFAYPYGFYTDMSEVLLFQMGIEITVTSDYNINTVVKGLPQTLRAMGRITIDGEHQGQDFIDFLESFY